MWTLNDNTKMRYCNSATSNTRTYCVPFTPAHFARFCRAVGLPKLADCMPKTVDVNSSWLYESIVVYLSQMVPLSRIHALLGKITVKSYKIFEISAASGTNSGEN